MRTLRSAAGIAAGAMLVGGTLSVGSVAGGSPSGGLWTAELAVAQPEAAVIPAAVEPPVVVEEHPHPRFADDPYLAETLAALRQCESDDRYAINTGNGYYGAYQFDPTTWWSLGYGGMPNDAPPEVQDEAAAELHDRSGWAPWPGCASQLGLI